MSSAPARWQLVPPPEAPKVRQLATALGIDSLTAQVLIQRGIETFEQSRSYFKPTWADLHDPFLMLGMKTAAQCLAAAMQDRQTILVYGDYDVDGTTSIALVSFFLSRYRHNIGYTHEYYVPDRYGEGYGLSRAGVEFAHSIGAALMVVLDCGIKDFDALAYAQSLGIDVIVCDHHTPADTLPPATAILNPKQPGCNYPFKELSGCGIGLKLVQATSTLLNLGFQADEVMDLVALSIACDIAPMIGENRTMAALGLEKLRSNPSRGIATLKGLSDKDRPWQISDLVFFIGPRINAAGRIGHASQAVDLLLGLDPDLDTLARGLEAVNLERRSIEAGVFEEAMAQATSIPDPSGFVLAGEHWHKGVVGIVAAKIVDQFHRPSILLALNDGLWAGSARSIPGFDLYGALEQCAPLLNKFGGHRHAAGLSLYPDQLEAFREAFTNVCRAELSESMLQPTQLIDGEIAFADITPKFARLHQRMEPFGPANRRPVFVARNLLVEKSYFLNGGHLKLVLRHGQTLFDGIGFGLTERFKAIPSDTPLAIAFYPEYHHYLGQTQLRLHIKDIKADTQTTSLY